MNAAITALFDGVPDAGVLQADIESACDVRYALPLLYWLPRLAHAKTIIEIGMADGSTTIPLLAAAVETGGRVISIDPDVGETTERGRALIDRCGLAAQHELHRCTSDTFFASFADVIDFAFVDGDHRAEYVLRDFENCWRRLRPGGLAAGHDIDPLPAGDDAIVLAECARDPAAKGVAKALTLVLLRNHDIDVLPFGPPLHDLPAFGWPGIPIVLTRKRPVDERALRIGRAESDEVLAALARTRGTS